MIRASGLANDFRVYTANDDVEINRIRGFAEARMPGYAITDLSPLGWEEARARHEHASAQILERQANVDGWAYAASISPTARALVDVERAAIADLRKQKDALEFLLRCRRVAAHRGA